jgi:hypothetical protein
MASLAESNGASYWTRIRGLLRDTRAYQPIGPGPDLTIRYDLKKESSGFPLGVAPGAKSRRELAAAKRVLCGETLDE